MRRSIDDHPFDPTLDPVVADDPDLTPVSWAIAISDDYDDAEPRIVLTVDELGKPGDAELISAYMPRIRSNLILLLSSKTSADVATAEGKARLKAQIRSVINESLADSGHADVVRSVVFTSFIVQLQ